MPVICSFYPAAPATHTSKGEHRDVTGFYQRKQGGKRPKKGK
jgi:hypothetical protein